METTSYTGLIDTFISYGRKESKHFAKRVRDYLEKQGLSVWLDLEEIDVGTDWQDRIDKGIASSKNFIFIIAPHAINSTHCKKEIELAIAYNKRIVPVLHVDRGLESLNPFIGEINFLPIKEREDTTQPPEKWESIDDFEEGAELLVTTIKEADEYNSAHAYLLLKALEWDTYNKKSEYLLVDQERLDAQSLLDKQKQSDEPNELSLLHCAYICEARKNAESMMTDVFLCYAAADVKDAIVLNNALITNGKTTWFDRQDVKPGSELMESVYEGIELSDNFLFCISEKALDSESCMEELKYALSLNKRVIPIILQKVSKGKIPQELSKLKNIDLTDNNPNTVKLAKKGKSDFDRDVDALIAQLEQDEEYHHKHKRLLVQAKRWKNMGESDSFLLREDNLLQSQEWYNEGLQRPNLPPIDLHKEFLEASNSQSGILNSEVFISYSPKDTDFARKLNLKLQSFRKTTWFDQESIMSTSKGSDYEQKAQNGISESINFLFILSENSIESEFCQREVKFAAEQGKRFLVVVLDDKTPPPEFPEGTQLINFHSDKFDVAFGALMHALNIDEEYVREHNHLQRKASEWDKQGRKKVISFMLRRADGNLLLKRTDYLHVKGWLKKAENEKKIPAITKLQKDYLTLCSRFFKTRKNILLAFLVAVMSIFPIYMYFSIKEARENMALSYIYAAKQVLDKEHDPIRALSIAKEATELISDHSLNQLLPVLREISNSLSEHTVTLSQPIQQMQLVKIDGTESLMTYVGNTLSLRALDGSKVAGKSTFKFSSDVLDVQAGHGILFIRDANRNVYSIDLEAKARTIKTVTGQGLTGSMQVFDEGGGVFVQYEKGSSRLYTQLKGTWGWRGTYNHRAALVGGVISPDQKTLFTFAKDNTVRLWTLTRFSKHLLDEVRLGPKKIDFAEFAKDGSKLMTHFTDNDLIIWKIEDGELIEHKTFEEVKHASFTYVPNLIMVHDLGGKASLKEIEGSFFRELSTFAQLGQKIDSVIISEDKKVLLSYQKGKGVATWELNGELLGEIDFDDENSATDQIGLSPTGRYVIRTDKTGAIFLWEKNGKPFATLKSHKEKINHFAFSVDSTKFFTSSADGILNIWSANDATFDKGNLEKQVAEKEVNLKKTITDWFSAHNVDTLQMAEVDRVRFGIIRDFQEVISSNNPSVLSVYADYYKEQADNSLDEGEKKQYQGRVLAIYKKIQQLGFGTVNTQVEIVELELALGNELDFEKSFDLKTNEEKYFVAQYLSQKFGSYPLDEKILAYEKVEKLYNEILLANDSSSNIALFKRYAANNYNSLSYYYIQSGEVKKGIEKALLGKEKDPTYDWIDTKIALGYLYDKKFLNAIPLLTDMREKGDFGPDNYQDRMKRYIQHIDSIHQSVGLPALKEIIAAEADGLSENDKDLLKLFGGN